MLRNIRQLCFTTLICSVVILPILNNKMYRKCGGYCKSFKIIINEVPDLFIEQRYCGFEMLFQIVVYFQFIKAFTIGCCLIKPIRSCGAAWPGGRPYRFFEELNCRAADYLGFWGAELPGPRP